jgi:uncharacterized protein YggU (UPF0235/DUF167 family)
VSAPSNRPWRPLPGALAVSVRATPKGGRDAIEGITQVAHGQSALKIRVRAAPAEGEANDAIARVLARAAAVPPSSVGLLQGAAGRLKVFRIAGDPARLAVALGRAIAEQETKQK